ncbi:DsrE family protein [Actinoplanes solisilvae]|uniref:DsrE family protein n=1 Tax=Actinoplanes solisilvae TaxID=2486853 RepID=UPI0013E37F86|nr:DsrE family protein [Actinoplanes solisilvae]
MSELKTAVVILSDPSTGTDESVGRVLNGLAAAWDYGQVGEALVIFQGTGTRWPEKLQEAGHPVHALYQAVRDKIAVVASGGCSIAFGAKDSVADAGIETISNNKAPGTPGVASLRELTEQGYRVLTF